MTNYSILASNVKRGILRFSESICKNLSRPDFKFVTQIVYGILSSQSCQLTKIARALDEKALLKKTVDRLSKNLKRFKHNDEVWGNYIKKIKGSLSDKTVLIIDGSDITKPCSKEMEYIARVRDGSTGGYGDGYHTLGVVGLTPEKKLPISIYSKVYSASEPGFVSEDQEVIDALDFLSKHFKKSNIRAFDRGYDANIYYKRMIKAKERFIIRAKTNRNVIYKGKTVNIYSLARKFKGRFLLSFKKKDGTKAECKISMTEIELPCYPGVKLNLVVCNGLGMKPMMLITNMNSTDSRLAVTITKVYLMRWRIEEYYGFKKQQFEFEDFRVRSLSAIRTLDMFVCIASGYVGLLSEAADDESTATELIAISNRLKKKKFKFYAIADGLFALFAKVGNGIHKMIRKKPKSNQFSLFHEQGFCCSA